MDPNTYEDLDLLSKQCRSALERAGCRCVATVAASPRIRDLAFLAPTGARLLLRCGVRSGEEELSELGLVLVQKTFDRIALIDESAASAQKPTPFDIWSLEQLQTNARTLAETPAKVSA